MSRKILTFSLLLSAAAATSAAASMNISRDIVAQGVKPDWNLTVSKGTEFRLTRPGQPALSAAAPGAAMGPRSASWSAKTPAGQAMNVELQSQPCTAGGKSYPMTAKVTLGADILTGCAAHKP